jgi:hypothetical protein
METLKENNRLLVLSRLRAFDGHQTKTAASLGVGVRTLSLWLKAWKLDGVVNQKERFKMWPFITAKQVVHFGNPPNQTTIAAGALGTLENGAYKFDAESCEPNDGSGKPTYIDAELLMAKCQWAFEQFTMAVAHEGLKAGAPNTVKDLGRLDLTHIAERTYFWEDNIGKRHEITFKNPRAVYAKRGGSTHRIEDEDGGITFLPAPGYFGCIIKQKEKEGQPKLVA